MLTLKLISEETERVIKGLEKKHFNGAREAIDKVLEYDKIRRDAQQKSYATKQQANQLTKRLLNRLRTKLQTSKLNAKPLRRLWRKLKTT